MIKYAMRHYYPFGKSTHLLEQGSSLSAQAWDALRTEADDTHFSIPGNRETWLQHCRQSLSKDGAGDVAVRAAGVIAVVRKLGLRGIYSFGVGGGYLEYNLKEQAPDVWLSVSDAGSGWRARLAGVFHECDEFRIPDLLRDEFPSDSRCLYLLHRVETEFTNRQWHRIFRRLVESGAEHVLVIPNGLLTFSYWWRERRRFLGNRVRGVPCAFAGYVRNRRSLEDLWKADYEVEDERFYGHLRGFLLGQRRKHA